MCLGLLNIRHATSTSSSEKKEAAMKNKVEIILIEVAILPLKAIIWVVLTVLDWALTETPKPHPEWE